MGALLRGAGFRVCCCQTVAVSDVDVRLWRTMSRVWWVQAVGVLGLLLGPRPGRLTAVIGLLVVAVVVAMSRRDVVADSAAGTAGHAEGATVPSGACADRLPAWCRYCARFLLVDRGSAVPRNPVSAVVGPLRCPGGRDRACSAQVSTEDLTRWVSPAGGSPGQAQLSQVDTTRLAVRCCWSCTLVWQSEQRSVMRLLAGSRVAGQVS